MIRGRRAGTRLTIPRVALGTAAAAALAAWILTAVFELSEDAVVLTVIAVAFSVSWMITNRRPAASRNHSVTVVPVKVSTQQV